MKEAFYWQLVVTHAWILPTCFHVDCGRKNQLRLTRTSTMRTRWSSLASLKVNPPFDIVESWRATVRPEVCCRVARLYGRLVD